MNSNGIAIEVSGDDPLARAGVICVINEALLEKGFNDITQVNENGEAVPPQEEESLLAIIRRERPDIFTTPVIISEFETEPEELDEIVTSAHADVAREMPLNAPDDDVVSEEEIVLTT